VHPRRWIYARRRRQIGRRFLRGEGLEIGALHSPFPVPAGVRVRYVDRYTTAQLREEYPELADEPFAAVDIVDDGETLSTVADASQDFVIASHVLEHTQDPIGTLRQHLRVLRPGGVVLLALPDRRRDIDARRAPTSLEHLMADHEQGPLRSRAQHYREWAELVDLPLGYVEPDAVAGHAEQLERSQHSIHFHCWTLEEFLAQLPAFGLPATVAAARQNLHEFLVVLRRADGGSPDGAR
jgi:SAM-dependent methyltransferase